MISIKSKPILRILLLILSFQLCLYTYRYLFHYTTPLKNIYLNDPLLNIIQLNYTKTQTTLIKPSKIRNVDAIFCPIGDDAFRQSNMLRIQRELDIGITFFESIKAGDENFQEFYEERGWDFDTRVKYLKQAGCYFSHVTVWKEIGKSNHHNYLLKFRGSLSLVLCLKMMLI